jgi:hypothetical protein
LPERAHSSGGNNATRCSARSTGSRGQGLLHPLGVDEQRPAERERGPGQTFGIGAGAAGEGLRNSDGGVVDGGGAKIGGKVIRPACRW